MIKARLVFPVGLFLAAVTRFIESRRRMPMNLGDVLVRCSPAVAARQRTFVLRDGKRGGGMNLILQLT